MLALHCVMGVGKDSRLWCMSESHLIELSSVHIAYALKRGEASVGITLLGVTHPIREKHFRCGTCADGRFSSRVVRVKTADVWLL